MERFLCRDRACPCPKPNTDSHKGCPYDILLPLATACGIPFQQSLAPPTLFWFGRGFNPRPINTCFSYWLQRAAMRYPPGLENSLGKSKKCLTYKMKLDIIQMEEEKEIIGDQLLFDKCKWVKRVK